MGDTGLDAATVAFDHGPPVLDALTLLAGPGEILTVVGPSGSGKTTALRAVAGLEAVRGGRVLVAGYDVTDIPTPRRNVAMVFEATTLLPFLDIAANLARSTQDPAGRRGPDRRSGPDRWGLDRLWTRMPRTLSPGESGRAGVGRALLRSPDAFLFDEPLAHLAAGERARARRTIVDAVRRARVGTLWATHDQSEAMAVGDRLAVLRDGTVVQVDVPRAVYERPRDVFVAGFVGQPEIGLVPARAAAGGYRVGPRTLPLWGPLPAAVAAGREVLLGLRPEDVRAGDAGDSAAVRLPATVVALQRPGAVVIAEVAVAGESDGARIVARVGAGTRLRAGDRTELAVDVSRAHVFDPVTGLALHHPPSA